MRVRRISELVDLMQPAAVELMGEDRLVGPDVVIDNRAATDGALFVAIQGDRVDGHEYAAAAVEAGAAGVIGSHLTGADAPHLLAQDSIDALSWLARGIVAEARTRGMVSIGITGSSGKTSTKDLMAQVFEAVGPTVAPVGSQNNEVGVPLTACRVDDDTAYLVSEMGARGVGHIAWLTSLVGLDVGVCLNVGRAHIGEFGDMATTALAKSEIVADLPSDGWAVLNHDDPLVAAMADATTAKVAWFGEGDLVGGDMRVTARDVSMGALSMPSYTLVVSDADGDRTARVSLGVIGRHQVSNSLAAAAAALAVGIDLDAVAEALSAASPRSRWRMEPHRTGVGALVLNDAYNANPDSTSAALHTAAELLAAARQTHPHARLIAVLGDMLELGPDSARLHADIGRLAAELGAAEVIAVGSFADAIVTGATSGDSTGRVSPRDEVAASLNLGPGDVVLIKGSRGVGLESVATDLVARDGETS